MLTINVLINKLNKYKISHPNYYYLWYNYLISLKSFHNLEIIDNQLDSLISYLDKNIDISKNQLVSCLFTIEFLILT